MTATATSHNRFTLSNDRYLLALQRMAKRIEGGVKLVAVDSDEIGNKFTDCSWGMCSMDAAMWPVEDRFRPEPFSDGRVSAKGLSKGQLCPMDKREAGDTAGCFYNCRVFQSHRKDRPTKEQALELYQLAIAKVTA